MVSTRRTGRGDWPSYREIWNLGVEEFSCFTIFSPETLPATCSIRRSQILFKHVDYEKTTVAAQLKIVRSPNCGRVAADDAL
jgi:hypothetical protein